MREIIADKKTTNDKAPSGFIARLRQAVAVESQPTQSSLGR